jgi:hypothetical protein
MPTIEAKDCTVISYEVTNLLKASRKYPKQFILTSITIHFPRIKSKFETTKKCLHPATGVFRPEKGGVHTISIFFLDFRDLLFDLYIILK